MITVQTKGKHLVDDEVLWLWHGGLPVAVRLRIWRRQDEPSVVLVSSITKGVHPSRLSARLANLAYRAYLAFDREGLHFFEWDGEVLRCVNFLGLGHDERIRLVRPEYTTVAPGDLAAFIGHHVEL